MTWWYGCHSLNMKILQFGIDGGDGVPRSRENHRPVASHWQTLSQNVVSSTPHHERNPNST